MAKESKDPSKEADKIPEWRRLLMCMFSEFLGTFLLVFGDGAAKMVGSTMGQIDFLAQCIVPGFVVFSMIFTLGDVSGAHINPAVTLAFASRGAFPWRRVPIYLFSQVLGATLSATLLMHLFGMTENLGATLPHGSTQIAFSLEIILTAILVTVILGSASRSKLSGPDAAFAVAATIIVCSIIGKPISGASMNPARSLGPALISGRVDSLWIYLCGPALGALVGVLFCWLLHGEKTLKDRKAAEGDRAEKGEEQEEEKDS